MAEKKEKITQSVTVEGSVVDRMPSKNEEKKDETPVLIFMKEDHIHGHLGFLRKDNVYKVWKHWANLLKLDHSKVFRIVTKEEAAKIIERNQKKIDAAIEKAARESENKDTESPENKDAGGSDRKKETK